MSNVSEVITLDIMYRDADNYKNSDTICYSNDQDIPDEVIMTSLQKLIDEEGFIPAYYNMPSISPVDNEFLEHEGPDHPFQTIEAVFFGDMDPHVCIHEDISKLILLIENESIVEAARALAKTEAKESLQRQLLDLGDIDPTKVVITIEGGIVTQVGGNKSSIQIVILDFDKNADEPVVISEQLEPDYIFPNGEAWKNWEPEDQNYIDMKPEDKEVMRHLKQIKF